MSDNLTLGAGKLYFAPFASGTQTAGGRRYFGNTPGFSLNVTQEKLQHFSSDSAMKEMDADKVISTTRTASITTDEIDADNLALAFLGTKATVTNTLTTVTDDPIASVQKGLYYQLGVSDARPAGYRGLTPHSGGVNIIVKDDQVAPVTFDEGDDYTVDMATGQIYITENSGITNGTNLEVTYKVAAGSYEQIISGNDAVEGELYYIADNQAGANRDLLMPKVSLTPNGDIDMKSAQWQQIGFQVSILKKAGREALYLNGRKV